MKTVTIITGKQLSGKTTAMRNAVGGSFTPTIMWDGVNRFRDLETLKEIIRENKYDIVASSQDLRKSDFSEFNNITFIQL